MPNIAGANADCPLSNMAALNDTTIIELAWPLAGRRSSAIGRQAADARGVL